MVDAGVATGVAVPLTGRSGASAAADSLVADGVGVGVAVAVSSGEISRGSIGVKTSLQLGHWSVI
jgi:hypothetical protein